ncbi:c-type cytochrome biogenesis protein CcmI [Ponticaulis profundi]|uniref:C-type cytochrome biogenesis protein CcmI n=1 Tax=Ponticaulis profundi TaxID=2665222 RepID=A0ABW1S6Z0_9PROT
MIWILLLILTALAVLFVLPSLQKPAEVDARAILERELAASKSQLAQIEDEIASGFHDEESAARAKRAMQRRVLKLGTRLDAAIAGEEAALSPMVKWGVPALIAIGAIGLYAVIGAPNYRNQAPEQIVIPEEMQNMPLDQLAVMLETKLQEAENPEPIGYVVLARAKLGLRDVDGAIAAYETALEASNGDPRIESELAQARALKAQIDAGTAAPIAPQLDQGQVEAMQDMSPEDRQQVIRGMVDGLASRLDENPDDLQGWLRLIRARTVLAEYDQASADLARARDAFAGNPDAQAAFDRLEIELNSAKSVTP